MGQKNSKEAKGHSPDASIFPIGGGHTGEVPPTQRDPTALQTAAPEVPHAAATSSKGVPTSEIQPDEGTGAIGSSVAGPSRQTEIPSAGTVASSGAGPGRQTGIPPTEPIAKHDIVDNPMFDSDSNDEHPHVPSNDMPVRTLPDVSGGKGGLHTASSSEGPMAPPNTPAVSKAVLPSGLVNESHSGEGAALVGSGAAATKPQGTLESQGDTDKVGQGGCFPCFAAAPKAEDGQKGKVEEAPTITHTPSAAAEPLATETAPAAVPVAVPAAVGAGVKEPKQDIPVPPPATTTTTAPTHIPTPDIQKEIPTPQKDEEWHPHPIALPPPPRCETSPPPQSTEGSKPAFGDAGASQPGETVTRTYSRNESSESTHISTTTGLPTAAVAVPAGVAGGVVGAHAGAHAGKNAEKPAVVEPAPAVAGPTTPDVQAEKAVSRAGGTPVRNPILEQADSYDGRLSTQDITEMPGIGGSLPAVPSREAGSVATGGDTETTPKKPPHGAPSDASSTLDGQMTPLTKMQTTHEAMEDMVDVPSGKGYLRPQGLDVPKSSTEITRGDAPALKSEELQSKLENLTPQAERTVEYEPTTVEHAETTAGPSTATATPADAHIAEVAAGSALAAGAAAGAANAALANKEFSNKEIEAAEKPKSKKELLAAQKSSKKMLKQQEAAEKAERHAQEQSLKQKEKEDKAAFKQKLAEEKAFKKEQRQKQKAELNSKVSKAGEGKPAEGEEQAAPKKGFLGGLFSKSSTGTPAASSGSPASGATSTAAATGSSGAGLGAAAGVGVAAGVAGGAAGGVLASRGIKSEKREGKPTQDVAVPSSDTVSAATTTGAVAGSSHAPSIGGTAVAFDNPTYEGADVREGAALEGPITPAASEAGAEKPKKTKTRRNIDYSAIQMEKSRAAGASTSSAARLREGYNPATGLYEPTRMEARTPAGAYSPMKTSHPTLRQSAMEAKQASLQRKQSMVERPPAPQTPRTSSWARGPAISPAGRGIDRIEASFNKQDYRPMSSTFG